MSCICAVCLKFVKKNQRNLKCTICKMYVHKCCSDATGKEFRKKTHFKYWHCSKCNDLIALPFNHIVDDREFLLEIYRTFCDRMPKEFKNYDHFIFNPLENKNVLGDVYNPECNSNSEYFTDEELDASKFKVVIHTLSLERCCVHSRKNAVLPRKIILIP